ncbi:Transketolase [Massospora cicadina]|nr:Transketolase [Massospora cicadina]
MPSKVDQLAINTLRLLSADQVQAANSGHPGAPMGCAPMAHALFSKFMKFNSKNPSWVSRDRFVLSNGHASALLYSLLHVSGYKVSIDDLKAFRQTGSATPGHPESHLTEGVEVTTGPLGQGIANAVGLAAAEAHLAATFNTEEFEVIDNYTYCILGDGCMQEGVASEASSLAGHLKLGKLIALYDDNGIQIDGETKLGFTEDVLKRYEAYGWHVLHVKNGDEDWEGLLAAIEEGKKATDKPTLIKVTTTIGFGSAVAGSAKVHGSPLGKDVLKEVKKAFGFNPEESFVVPAEVHKLYEEVQQRGAQLEREWNAMFERYATKHPEKASEFKRRFMGRLPEGWEKHLPTFKASDPSIATRKASGDVLNALAPHIPELVGGSADLTPSNLTFGRVLLISSTPPTEAIMLVAISDLEYANTGWQLLSTAYYGVGALRLTALSERQAIYILTHDSIGLGEDGPTHQPIETLAMLRATPNLYVVRPADEAHPLSFSLSRQNVPMLANSSIEKALHGAYVLEDVANPQVILVATGTEVAIINEAAQNLNSQGIAARVVSMPCQEVFKEQLLEYKESVFPPGIPVVSCEALSTFGWQAYAHASVGMKAFGSCGPYQELYVKFGFTSEHVAQKAKSVIDFYKSSNTMPAPLMRLGEF